MTMMEMMWGMISMFCLIGIGFLLGIGGAYAKYLNASTNMITDLSKALKPLLEIYEKMLKDETE